jgi:hypothetical protein
VLVGLAPAEAVLDPAPAQEATWGGNYAVPVTPSRRGAYKGRVVVEELDGRHLHPPIVVDFPLTVGRPSGPGAGVWALLTFERLAKPSSPHGESSGARAVQ